MYEITANWLEIQEALWETGGEITPEIGEALDRLEGAFEAKAKSYCSVIQENLRAAEGIKAEIDRLSALQKTHANTAESLKGRLKEAMETTGHLKLDLGTFKPRIQRNGRPSIRWAGPIEELPEDYKRVRVELDGTLAYEAWRNGITLPEGFQVETGTHLRIQ